jgi:Thioesterase-like superfamily
MTWPDKITVYHRLTQDPSDTLARSFFQQEVVILSEAKQRPAARVLEQNFLFDYTKLSKTGTAPEFILEQFRRTWQQQEESRRAWQQQVADIENEVRRLELASWDNPNAVEDMGSAG